MRTIIYEGHEKYIFYVESPATNTKKKNTKVIFHKLANASIDKLTKFINILKRTFYNILSYHRYMHKSLTSQIIFITINMFYKLDCVKQNYYFYIHIIQVIITIIMLTRSSERILKI